jgi:hypothetical protein
MVSTLPPTPAYDPNIPIVTPQGGTTAAYKDPNSPESIMKRVTETKAQAAVDTKYDVATNPYKEGFRSSMRARKRSAQGTLMSFIIMILVAIVIYKTLKFAAKVFLIVLAVILLLILIGILSVKF